MFKSIYNIYYILRVIHVLARHDALFFLDDLNVPKFVILFFKMFAGKHEHLRKGERLANALYQLGPTYIKLGQALSIRADIVGDELADDLEKLQDSLPAFSGEDAILIIEAQLGKSIDELFDEFDSRPVAAASIAQVHFAKDKEGNEVAVKILRPEIEKKFACDIEFLNWVARVVTSTLPKYQRLKLVEVVESFAKTIHIEMDLRLEASAACELKENFKDDDDFIVPQINWDLTSQRVMTLERVSGIRIDDLDALKKAGINPHELLKKSSKIFFLQVFRDGFFHADQHPGNIFISPEGKIIAIDFGIMGRVDLQSRIYIAQMLNGFINRDYQHVADVHFDAGYIPANQDRDLFTQAIRAIGEPIHGKPQDKISLAKLLRQMFKVTDDFQMETQPQLLLLQKTMMLCEGMGRKLNPKANFWMISKPLVEQWAVDNLNPAARAKYAACEVKKSLSSLNNIIKLVNHLPNIITEDGIKLHPKTIDALAQRTTKYKSNIWKLIFIFAIVGFIVIKTLII